MANQAQKTLTLLIKNAPQVYGAELELQFNPDHIQIIDKKLEQGK